MNKIIKSSNDSLQQRVQHFAQLLLLLRNIQDKTRADFVQQLGDFSVQELNFINTIGDNEPCTMSLIAKQQMLSLSSITVIVDKLVAAGLVKRERSEEDRRIVYGRLTAAGKKIYQLQINHLHEILHRALSALTTAEQESLLQLMHKMVSNWQ